jgi:hypothetical protein
MMTVTEPILLYPKARDYPFDWVCERIVRALDERGWEVSGVAVEFRTFDTGEGEFRYVSRIEGDTWRLDFIRVQGGSWRISHSYNVSDIFIPKMELNVFYDGSGPVLYAYKGKDWKTDKQRFMDNSKVNSKLDGERRWYLRYEGHYNTWLTYVKDDREYKPSFWERKFYFNYGIYHKFAWWLFWHVLIPIHRHPK